MTEDEIGRLRTLTQSMKTDVDGLLIRVANVEVKTSKTETMFDRIKDILLGAALTGLVGMLLWFGLPHRGP